MSNILEFIAWLDDRKVLDAINALMTVALVLFAGVQLWRTEIERRERVRAAVGGFWIEYFRLWRVSKSWTDLDLTSLAYVDLFDPEEIL
ncbi:MAG: hypothetical protein JNL44_18165, partial [Gemmatimonadetes bacterium]|nr:hypothetical protein [Gemmatimonadota bacterium]